MGGKRFSWLHLTDFHFGLKGQKFLWPTLRQPFLDDLENLHKLSGPWQAVFFTGDFVQSGSPEQFKEMQSEVLDRIWQKLRELGSDNAVLLAVPGNHDLCRPDENGDDAARDMLLKEDGFSAIADKFWEKSDSGYRRVVSSAFAAYQSWWDSTPQRPQSNFKSGILPGDFACTIPFGGFRIGIVGLNTTFLQLKAGNYEKRLVWDARQIHEACGGAVDDWVKKHDACLLLTHQGPDWLTPQCGKHGETEIAPAGRFAAHFFGHLHETKVLYVKTGGGEAVRRCQTRSVFGMEKYGDPPATLRSHGYAAGCIEFEENGATLRIWPRIATDEIGPWRFVSDSIHAALQDDQATNPDAIALRMGEGRLRSVPPIVASAKGVDAASRSTFIAIPKSNWPEDLAVKGIEMPDSMLLRPESRIVRFNRLRVPLRDEIIGWAIDPAEFIKLRLHAGEGGSGKTRLLIEVCDQLERVHGWRAGFLDRSQSIESEFPKLLKEGKSCVIVLDYAESRTTEIVALVRAALSAKDAPRIRLVLLAREGGDWWDRIADAAGNDQATAAILRGINTKIGPYRMARERITEEDRATVFTEALEDFAKKKKLPIPIVPSPSLSDRLFENPLFIHLAALATLRNQNTVNDKELLSMALGHERSYWRQLINSLPLPEQLLPAFEQAVAVFTLGGGRRTAKEARTLLTRMPRGRDLDSDTRQNLFDGLRRLYPLEGGIGTLQPDLLGESLIGEALENDDELLDATIGEQNNDDEIRRALTVLTRLGRRVPTEQRWLKLGLERFLTKISVEALQVGMETGAPMPELHAQVLRSAERHDRRRAVEILQARLPAKSDNLVDLNVEVRRQAVALLEHRKTGSSAKRHIAYFEAMSSLVDALRERGLFAEAAEVASDAAAHAEIVFRSSDERDLRRLAGSLVNLSNSLVQIGRFQEALEKGEKAERIWRGLAEKQRDVDNADWALSLSNLSLYLGQVGRFQEALEKAEKAESIRHRLADRRSETYGADWATSLGVLSLTLTDLGRFEEALEKAEKEESIQRGLAERQPDANSADWARSLNNLDSRLSAVGRFQEALEKAEKAESIRRGFAEKQPDAHSADWARSLNNLGSRLGEVGRFQEALEKAEKAESIWRGLADEQPDVYSANWASVLGNLSSRLSEVGRFQEALEKAEKVESIRRGLAEQQPDAYSGAWAVALSNLGINLAALGRFQGALEKIEKAESIWRSLAEKQPDAHGVDWATSLSNLAEAQLSAGMFSVGLETANDALSKIMPHAERYPATYQRWVCFTHKIVSEAYLNLNRVEEGLVEARRSVDLWTDLASRSEDYDAIQIAKSFRTLIRLEIANGHNEAAATALTRTFEVLRKRIEINPRPLRSVLVESIDIVRASGNQNVDGLVPADLQALIN